MTYAEFKQNFLPEFLNINTFAGRIQYANQYLSRIGGGTGRIVYNIDNEKVLKLAKNNKGVAQNETEANTGYYRDTQHIVTIVFDSSDNDSWLISEKAKKVNEKRIIELTGIPNLHELYKYLKNFDSSNHGRGSIFGQDSNIVEQLNENEFAHDLQNLMNDYNQSVGDLGKTSSYGEVLRDGQPIIVLTDYGLNDEVYDTYYSPQRKRHHIYELYDNYDGNDDILSDIGNVGQDQRYGMWALPQYNVSDGEGVMNEKYNRNVADLIANQITNKLGLNNPNYLNYGVHGVAYDIGDDKILKITSDKSEAAENLKLINKPLKYIAHPYNVFSIKSKSGNTIPETYAIILEKLKTDPKKFYDLMERLKYVFSDILDYSFYGIFDYYIYGFGFYDKNKIKNYMSKNPEDANFFNNLLKIGFEAKQYGIESMDYLNYKNLGYKKNGNLGFFDVGFGDWKIEPTNKPQEIEISEYGGTKFTTYNDVSSDGFPSYEQNDTSPLTDNNIPTTVDEERNKKWMNDAQSVTVKKKCRLGGLGNTSVACNQGDINNLDIKPLEESTNLNIPRNKTFWAWVSPDDNFSIVPKLQHTKFIADRYPELSYDLDLLFNKAYKDGWVRVVYEYNPDRFMGSLSLSGYDKQRIKYVFKNMFFDLVKYGDNIIYIDYENPEGFDSIRTRDAEGKAKLINYINEEINIDFDKNKYIGKAYRVPTGFFNVRGTTAGDVVRFEKNELGNIDDFAHIDNEKLKELDNYTANDIIWVTKTFEDAKRYSNKNDFSDIEEFDINNGEIIAEDGDGGYLVLMKKNSLNEIGEGNAMTYSIIIEKSNDYSKTYKFKTEDNDEYFLEFENAGFDTNMWVVDFGLVNPSDITKTYTDVVNKGRMYKVMSTILKIIKGFFANTKPNELVIEPVKTENKYDKRRFALYLQYIKKNLPQNYEYTENEKEILIKKKKSLEKKFADEGVGDKFLANKFGISNNQEDIFNRQQNIENKKEIIREGNKKLIKNPKTLDNIGFSVRGVIDTEGNLYIEEKSNLIHFDILNMLDRLGLIVYVNYWEDKIPENYITVQRYGKLNKILIGESHFIFSSYYSRMSDKKYLPSREEVLPIFQKFLDKAKIKNPNINFINETIGEYMKEINKISLNETQLMSLQDLPFKKEIKQLGGKIFSVGGKTRDEFLGKESKDLDILITGIPMDNLEKILSKYGKVNAVGKSFGILKFKPQGSNEEIDIAIQREDKKTGEGGHKGFEVSSNHELPIETDLGRRVLTINAIAKDIDGNIIDPYNGREDIKNKIIRAVNSEAFSDDPLRMLRAIMFASRFGFTIEPNTMQMIQDNANRIKEISPERILIEFDKIIKKGDINLGVKLLISTGLFTQIFGGRPRKMSNLFSYVKTMGEFIYLLSVGVVQDPAEFYKNKLKGDIDTYKEIKALQMAFDSGEATNLIEARSVAHNMYITSSQSLQSQIIPNVIKTAAQELLQGKYPKTIGELQVNGNDLMSLGLKGKEIGDTLKTMLLKIYSNNVKNDKNELLNLVGKKNKLLNQEGVADKYAEKTFNIPDPNTAMNVKASGNIQKDIEKPYATSMDGKIIIYENPKSLIYFDDDVRAIADIYGNLFVAQESGNFTHGEMARILGINPIDIYDDDNYLLLNRIGDSNNFGLGDSSYEKLKMSFYGHKNAPSILNKTKNNNSQYNFYLDYYDDIDDNSILINEEYDENEEYNEIGDGKYLLNNNIVDINFFVNKYDEWNNMNGNPSYEDPSEVSVLEFLGNNYEDFSHNEKLKQNLLWILTDREVLNEEIYSFSNERNYLYHGTSDNAINRIQYDGGMKLNAANNNEPYISFTSLPKLAIYYASRKGGKERGDILRTKLTNDFELSPKYKNNKDGYEYITKREIPIIDLEILTNKGWIPLNNWDIIEKRIINSDNNKQKTDEEMINVGNKQISLNYIKQNWNNTNIKYTNNNFYKKIYNTAILNKKLTPKQWWYLDFLFKNGKSPHEAGILPKNI